MLQSMQKLQLTPTADLQKAGSQLIFGLAHFALISLKNNFRRDAPVFFSLAVFDLLHLTPIDQQ